MLHAVIMAGGAGTRFWPASRTLLPKQLLDLAGQRTMIQETFDRLDPLVPPDRVLVLTNRNLVDAVVQQLPQVPPQGILGEPCKRDTAPCVALAAALLLQRDADAVMVVLPADQVIRQQEPFRQTLALAERLVQQDDQRIVTLGIQPTYPAESFGYIERGPSLPTIVGEDTPVYRVNRFREKPSADVARQYLEIGGFYWNSGIFVWKAATILQAIQQYEPQMHDLICTIAAAADSDRFDDVFDRQFAEIQGKSIDFAVLEHYENVVVIPANFDWDDLGSWRSLERLYGVDQAGNTIVGAHVGIHTSGSIVRTNDTHLVATLGMTDCIIVHTEDATLVANKNDEEAIRQLVQMIRERGWNQYL